MRILVGLPIIAVLYVLRWLGWEFGVDESC